MFHPFASILRAAVPQRVFVEFDDTEERMAGLLGSSACCRILLSVVTACDIGPTQLTDSFQLFGIS